jgi:UDP-N-acetylmuramoylalanine--D-glutamate ligase
MKIAILGFAGQGQSSYEYWDKDGNEITICDSNPDIEVPEGVKTQLGPNSLKNLDKFDLLVRTPILHPSKIVASSGPEILKKVTSNTNEFFKVCPTQNIIGVTGTKGKGTTSTLIAKILEAAGHKVHLGGNIGTPPLELLKGTIQANDWIVLELANFQLIDLKYSPKIAVCLMVEPEHLDWHENLREYIAAKQRIFAHQTKDDTAIYYAKNRNSVEVASVSSANKIAYMADRGAEVVDGYVRIRGQNIIKTEDIKLLGKHNWQNVCAAVTAVWQFTQDIVAIQSAVQNFEGLEHRLEFVRDLNRVKYYDDSFGTTPSTAQVAIDAFAEPKVLILGGSNKGSSYDELAKAVSNGNVKHVLLIGNRAQQIQEALDRVGYSGYTDGGENMAEVVRNAKDRAEAGDIVLLSTGCASFGMFKNYRDRGEQFQQAVKAL